MKLTKIFALIIAAATLTVACEKKSDNTNVGTEAKLVADNNSVEVNSPITFTVTDSEGNDVTSIAVIFDKTHDFVEVSNPYTPTADGEYVFYAIAGTAISNEITVTVVPTVPAIPEDVEPANTSFNHHVLLVDHTGTNCGYCPKMMLALKEVEEDAAYHGKYYEAMAHSYNTSDPSYSAAAAAISGYYHVNDYPTLCYNFLYDINSSYNSGHIKQQIDALWKESADAGIAAAVNLATEVVVVNAEVKAAVTNDYRVTAWLLEDNIAGVQMNATADWMNVHNNAIRQTATMEPISGYDLGTINAGETASTAMTLKISTNRWNRDNFKVMIIASAKNQSGNFEVANITICPVDDVVTYDYKK
jgi:thiol-disulfide isomerase/thioredoxin